MCRVCMLREKVWLGGMCYSHATNDPADLYHGASSADPNPGDLCKGPNLEDGAGAGGGEGDGQDAAVAPPDGGLSPDHARRVRQHHDRHYGVAAPGQTTCPIRMAVSPPTGSDSITIATMG